MVVAKTEMWSWRGLLQLSTGAACVARPRGRLVSICQDIFEATFEYNMHLPLKSLGIPVAFESTWLGHD